MSWPNWMGQASCFFPPTSCLGAQAGSYHHMGFKSRACDKLSGLWPNSGASESLHERLLTTASCPHSLYGCSFEGSPWKESPQVIAQRKWSYLFHCLRRRIALAIWRRSRYCWLRNTTEMSRQLDPDTLWITLMGWCQYRAFAFCWNLVTTFFSNWINYGLSKHLTVWRIGVHIYLWLLIKGNCDTTRSGARKTQ